MMSKKKNKVYYTMYHKSYDPFRIQYDGLNYTVQKKGAKDKDGDHYWTSLGYYSKLQGSLKRFAKEVIEHKMGAKNHKVDFSDMINFIVNSERKTYEIIDTLLKKHRINHKTLNNG